MEHRAPSSSVASSATQASHTTPREGRGASEGPLLDAGGGLEGVEVLVLVRRVDNATPDGDPQEAGCSSGGGLPQWGPGGGPDRAPKLGTLAARTVPSSSGPGHHPLKVETRVRTPLGLLG